MAGHLHRWVQIEIEVGERTVLLWVLVGVSAVETGAREGSFHCRWAVGVVESGSWVHHALAVPGSWVQVLVRRACAVVVAGGMVAVAAVDCAG